MRTIPFLLLVSLTIVGGCAASTADEHEPGARDEAPLVHSDVLLIEDLAEPKASVHVTLPGSYECGFRLQISDQASVGWNFFLLPTFLEVLPATSRVDLDFLAKSLTITLVDPPPAWDIWMTIKTRDGRSIAEAVESSVNARRGEPLGTIAPIRCPKKRAE
jgi:hypothetical protein